MAMTAQRMWVAVIVATIAFIALTAWSQHSVSAVRPVYAAEVPHTTTVIDNITPAVPFREHEVDEPRFDLNGNEVDEAVGDYRIDPEGQMYERHAPDTALLHLSAPEL
jgi:hypothetical protein